MWKKLRRIGLLGKALLFTVAVHGILLAFLLYNFNWTNTAKRGGKPIQAAAVEDPDIAAERAARELEESLRKQREEAARKQKAIEEEKQRKAAEEEKKKEEEAKRKAEAERKQKAAEAKRKAEEERKREEAEAKRKAEEERKKKEAEAKRKAEEEKKRKAAEAEKKRKAEALQKQLAEELRAKTEREANDAFEALIARIQAAVENNWRRPVSSRAGLTVTIRVKVARDGRVTSARVTRSSGDPFFDQSAERAVNKASPLPFPSNPEYYEFINEFDFKFSPDE